MEEFTRCGSDYFSAISLRYIYELPSREGANAFADRMSFARAKAALIADASAPFQGYGMGTAAWTSFELTLSTELLTAVTT